MKKNALFASRVCTTEEFTTMSHEAQVLYYLIGFEQETDGEVLNPSRIARSYRISPEALEELYENDYLLECDGTTFVRHNWVNNKCNARAWNCMDGCEAYVSGLLEFEGTEGKSAYRLADLSDHRQSDAKETLERHQSDAKETLERHQSDDGTGAEGRSSVDQTKRNSNSNSNTNTNLNSTVNTNLNSTHTLELASEDVPLPSATVAHPCTCKKCGSTNATYEASGGQTTIYCPTCGAYPYDPHNVQGKRLF